MPNTKSAERRMRNSERKRLHNRSIESRLRKTERDFRVLITAGKKDEASKALAGVLSAFDKAAKSGVVHKAAADRKKSRLTLSLNRLK
ncbi:MAG TPA: 30S ribosomal protein S20 [Verrucomicrobiota bacterium]|nr:30S ribosomal protein S20 [Verrucomicrobiota bacterium]